MRRTCASTSREHSPTISAACDGDIGSGTGGVATPSEASCSTSRATEVGYHHGIRTVLTANGAAFIGAFLLWYLTVGPVRGFAYFLGISVIVDLAVAVMFTRPLILLLSRSPRFAQSTFFSMGADPTTSPAMSKKVAMR